MSDSAPTRRRLAAVLFADIVGFSTLASSDEDRALALASIFREVFRSSVEEAGGRVVKFLGDGGLAVFDSAETAAASARSVRAGFRSAADAAGTKASLRIGVHTGDVVEAPDGDVHGDGVNTAARLQSAAAADEILVSEAVWRQLRQRREFSFAFRGERTLKGLATPERTYALGAAGEHPPVEHAVAPEAGDAARALPRRTVLAAGTVAGLVVGLGAGALVAPLRPDPRVAYRRLTFRRGMIRSARFGPDGQTILFGALWEGDVCRVHVVRPDSPESHPLDLPPATPLAVSRQGEVALALGAHYRGVMSFGTLARVPLAGGSPRELAEDVKFADWSPDGSELAIVRRVGGREVLEYPMGNVLHEGPGAPSSGGFSFPRVSPRGDRVACFELTSGLQGRVIVVDQAGTVTPLSAEHPNVFGLAWHGERIWYTASGDQPLFRLLHVVEMGGSPRVVSHVPGNMSVHDVTADGRLLIAHTDDRGGLAVRPRGATTESDLSWHDASMAADISADGGSILFSEYGQGGGEPNAVYLRPTDGGSAVRLGEGRAEALSPDGRWAAVRAPGAPSPWLDLLPTGAGETRRVQRAGFGYHAVRWHPGGRELLALGQEGSEPARLYLHDLDGSSLRAVTPPGHGPPWAPSPDGRRVAATGPEGQLLLHPLEPGEARPVPGLHPGSGLVGWIRDGLLVTEGNSALDLGQVTLIDPDTGVRKPWRTIAPFDPSGIMFVSNLRVSPDGASYAYSWHRALSNLYQVEGLIP